LNIIAISSYDIKSDGFFAIKLKQKASFFLFSKCTVHIHIGTLFATSTQTVPSLHMHSLFFAENKTAMENNPANVSSELFPFKYFHWS
jgi:hypothetical protein